MFGPTKDEKRTAESTKLRPKKITCISVNMPKKNRVGWSESLFIYLFIYFILFFFVLIFVG